MQWYPPEGEGALGALPRPLLNGGRAVQGFPGAVTMAVAGDSQSGWGQSLAVGGAVAGGLRGKQRREAKGCVTLG